MKGLLAFVPDGRYELRSFGTDGERNSVCAYGVFSVTHTGPGSPCAPTGKIVRTDYVYVMNFDGQKIRHMTKIWNAGVAMKSLDGSSPQPGGTRITSQLLYMVIESTSNSMLRCLAKRLPHCELLGSLSIQLSRPSCCL
jgi:hypothetical protein